MVAVLARTVAETGWGPDLLSRHFAAAFGDRPPPGDVHAIDAASHVSSAMHLAGMRSSPTPSAHARMQATDIGEGDGVIGAERAAVKTGRSPAADRGAPTMAPATAPATAQAQDWGSLLRRHFWLGDRFRDRLGSDDTSGEASIWPFFAGLVDDREMLAAALGTLRREGYTAPFPLRFEATHRLDRLVPAYRLWSADYQTTTSWTSLGSIYLALLRQVDPEAARAQLHRMRALIERDGTFWEVLDARGEPWRSRSHLSVSDASMLWGAILLERLAPTMGER
jgi:hypothetical protein